MIRAVYRDGKLEPLEAVPEGWHDGDRLVVQQEETIPTAEGLERWAAEVEEAAARIPEQDHDRVSSAIAEHRAEAKRWMHREMGLPE
jgi:hypothetical protein